MTFAIREVENIDAEVRATLRQIGDEVSQLEQGMASETDFERMSKKIEHCKLRIKTMEIELETVKNRDTARKFKPVIRDHNNKIKEYQQTLDWNQQNANDNHSSYGKRKSKPNSDNILNDENAAIAYGTRLHDEMDSAADRIIRDVQETTDVAIGIAEQVDEQTKQIAGIDATLSEIDSEVDKATIVMRRMSRRVMTDKYIWILIALVLMAIIGVIVASVLGEDGGSSDSGLNNRRMLFYE